MALEELKSGAGKSADLYDLLKIPARSGKERKNGHDFEGTVD